MADYIAKLVPSLLNFATESGLDTSIDANGNSLQRTINCLEVGTAGARKSVSVVDGGEFDDVEQTLLNVDGIIEG